MLVKSQETTKNFDLPEFTTGNHPLGVMQCNRSKALF